MTGENVAGGKNNTQRIETLESQAANMSARLDVHDIEIKGVADLLKTSSDSTRGHTTKITVIEQQLIVLTDLKESKVLIAAIEKELIGFKKDLESLQKTSDDQKKEKDEATRRWWAFGPNFLAAIISAIITIVGLAINIWFTYWLKMNTPPGP